MKTADPALVSLLQSKRAFFVADLYTITLQDNSSVRYTTFDLNLVVSGQTFSSVGHVIERSSIREVRGVEVDRMSLKISTHSLSILGMPFMQAVASGKLDGAYVTLEQLFMATPGDTSIPPLMRFKGRVSETQNTRTTAELSVASDLELLNTKFPKGVYQPGCMNTLYDVCCTLTKTSYQVNGAVQSGSTTTKVKSNLAQADGYFTLGVVTFLSGPNIGVSRTVKSYAGGEVGVSYPLPFQPTVGDTFKIFPGCDKRQTTCETKFNNVVNFKGFPYVPKPEVLL